MTSHLLTLLQGTSPVAASSPPAPKRSPTARFSISVADSASSPRNSLARSRPAAPQVEEDIIPTASLLDDVPMRASPAGGDAVSSELLSTPPALDAGPDTTTLHVFGPPVEHLPALRPYLENIGPVVSYSPGPDGSNWWTVQYANSLAASYALRRHGEIVSGRWMLGFKVAGPGSTQGLTLVNGVGSAATSSTAANGGGAGTPVQLMNANIIRSKPKPAVAKDEYAWEEPEQPNGIIGRAAEFIVSWRILVHS